MNALAAIGGLVGARGFRIVLSGRGELLTFDRAAGGLRFAGLSSSAANVGVVEDSDRVDCIEPLSRAGTLPGDPLHWTPRGRGPLATLSGLGPDLPVLLAEASLLVTLRDLAAGTWLRQTSPAALPDGGFLLQGLSWPEEFVADLGGMQIDLTASLELLARPSDPDALFVVDPHARIERLLRYEPVVAYTAFGPNMALFRCLEASLYSLSRVAGFSGRVVILSDRDRPDLEFLVPGEMRARTHFELFAAADVMAMALARYALPTLPAVQLACPLLYVDTDVIFDAPIERLLAEIRLAQRICVFAEDDLRHPMDFYGAELFAADPSFTPRSERGFSTGVLGIPDVGPAAEPFRALLALAAAQLARSGRRVSTAFDQRFANYLFHKLLDYDDVTVNRHETCCNGRDPDLANRRGIAHFAGGVGQAGPKLERMNAYLADLQRADGRVG